MRLIERRIRQYFAFQAIVPMLALLVSIFKPVPVHPGSSPGRQYGIAASYLILAIIYGRAWFATRKPREFRSPWPMAASLISVAVGSCSYWFARPSLGYEAPGMITIAMGLGGFLIYSQGRSPRSQVASSDAAADPNRN
jgi:hypothetical protein